jgi:hypothetical protein
MRGMVLAGSLVALVAMASPARAQASFERVPEAGSGVIYWDTAGLKRTGDAFEVEVLRVFKSAPGKPLEGGIERHRLSCVWSASVGSLLGRRSINEAGKVLETAGSEPFSQTSFYGPHGWQALVAPLACDPARKPANGLTAAKAMADAKVQLAAKPVSEPGSKRAAALPADNAPARFGLIRTEKGTGHMSFLDWSRITRADDKAMVQTDVLGDDSMPPPEPQWNYSVIALRTLALDCKARTLTQTGYFTFTKSLEPGFPDGMTWPVRTAADWPLGAQILDAAGTGKEPAKTFASRAAAIAHQRSVHPLRK